MSAPTDSVADGASAPARAEAALGVEPDRPLSLFDQALEALAALVLSTIVLLLFGNAVLRFTSDISWAWSTEVVTGLVVWLTMIGFTIGVRRDDSIRVRALVRLAPESWQVVAKVVTDLVSVVVLVHLAWYAYQFVDVFGSDATPYLRLPQGFFTAALPVGAALSAVVILLQLKRSRATVRRWSEEEQG